MQCPPPQQFHCRWSHNTTETHEKRQKKTEFHTSQEENTAGDRRNNIFLHCSGKERMKYEPPAVALFGLDWSELPMANISKL